jgi:hypothetical protein
MSRSWPVMLLLAVVMISPALGADVNELVRRSLKAYTEKEAIGAEMRKATANESARMSALWSAISALKKPAPDAEKVKGYEHSMEYARTQIAMYELLIELAKITDPAKRAEKLKEVEAERKTIREKQRELGKPFNDRISELGRAADADAKAFDDAMKAYCLTPGGEFKGAVPKSTRATPSDAFISYNWNDADGKQVAWAHLRLRDKPETRKDAKLLDGKHAITSHSGSSMWVWVGHFKVAFIMSKKEWQSKEMIAKAVKAFIDLDGLAKLDAAPEAEK